MSYPATVKTGYFDTIRIGYNTHATTRLRAQNPTSLQHVFFCSELLVLLVLKIHENLIYVIKTNHLPT